MKNTVSYIVEIEMTGALVKDETHNREIFPTSWYFDKIRQKLENNELSSIVRKFYVNQRRTKHYNNHLTEDISQARDFSTPKEALTSLKKLYGKEYIESNCDKFFKYRIIKIDKSYSYLEDINS